MGRIHLCRQKHPEVWYILEEDVDYIGAMHNGLVSRLNTEDVAQADSLTDLLHKLQDSGDERWYLRTNFIDSKHRTRDTHYPKHREIHLLVGFISEVCDIKKEESYIAEWQVWFPSELWVEINKYELRKVQGFSEKMLRDAEKYIETKELIYEAEDEEHG